MKYPKVLYLILLFTFIFSISSVLSETKAITNTDFLFYRSKNALLYPEINFISNPSVLYGLLNPLIINDLKLSCDLEETKRKRLDDSIGKLGGTQDSMDLGIYPDLLLFYFHPFQKGWVGGLGAEYSSKNEIMKNVFINYDSFTERKTELTKSLPFEAGLNLYAAKKTLKRLRFGFEAGYLYKLEPKYFTWVTDETVDPVLQYTSAAGNSISKNTNEFTATAGLGLPFSIIDLSAGVKLTESIINGKNEYISVDTDDDGYSDTVMLYSDYIFRTEAGGPEDPAVSFDHRDITTATKVELFPCISFSLSENSSLIFDGNYSILDLTVQNYHKRITTENILKDESWTKRVYNAGLRSFDVMGVLVMERPEKKREFRIGAGYSRYNQRYTQDGYTPAGLRVYNRLNENNYTELSLGLDPINDGLVSGSLYPSDILVNSLSACGAMDWTPLYKIRFYTNLDISASKYVETYNIFNIDTRTVWTELIESSSIRWQINTLIGMAFPLGEKAIFTFDCGSLNTAGDLLFEKETSPYDTEIGRYSENGESDLESSNEMAIQVNLGVIISK